MSCSSWWSRIAASCRRCSRSSTSCNEGWTKPPPPNWKTNTSQIVLDLARGRCQTRNVDPLNPKPEATHSDIQEILRKRREMLNRVKEDLLKVGKLQENFWGAEQKPPAQRDK